MLLFRARCLIGRRLAFRRLFWSRSLLTAVGHGHHRGTQHVARHAIALLVHVVDRLVILRRILNASDGLLLKRIECLALGIDGLHALMGKHVEHLGVDRIHAVYELAKIVGHIQGAGVIDSTLDVVDHRQQGTHELLGSALALRQALVCRTTAEVLPVGLEASRALGSLVSLVLSSFLRFGSSVESSERTSASSF